MAGDTDMLEPIDPEECEHCACVNGCFECWYNVPCCWCGGGPEEDEDGSI